MNPTTSWVLRGLAATILFAAPCVARAEVPARRYDIPAGDLAESLNRIAHDADVSLLFDRTRVQALKAPALHLSGSPQQVFGAALAGSGLTVKQVGPEAYALIGAPAVSPSSTAVPAPVALPEILIVGQRSQNADIPRRARDVQPYRVLTVDDVAAAQDNTSDQLLRDWEPANEITALSRQSPTGLGGSVASQIDLRGLGTAQTLVLVDGRRMPSLPTMNYDQPDVTGLPQAAIERVETLGGTTGGLYGPGATGGVVNIILKHDYQAPWIQAQAGVDQRGDGQQSRVDGGFSYQLPMIGTQISIMADYGSDDGLTLGARSFAALAQQLRAERSPQFDPPVSTNINVMSIDGSNLVLTPQFGSRSLGSSITNLPPNSGGPTGNEVALLLAGTGRYDYRLSNDGNGSAQSLLTPSRTAAAIADIRQPIGDRVELFSDVLFLSDLGVAVVPSLNPATFTLSPGQYGNPFLNTVAVSIPTPGYQSDAVVLSQTTRATGGAIVHLPAAWSLEGDATWAQSHLYALVPNFFDASLSSPADVFTPGSSLAGALAATPSNAMKGGVSNILHDYALRAAGPLWGLPGGPMALTLSLEHRDEAISEDASSQSTNSASGELRAPLIGSKSRILPLRGLELQLAGRVDDYDISEANLLDEYSPASPAIFHVRHTTLAFTAGAKATPVAGLIVRASFATGYLPPTPGQISPIIFPNLLLTPDPERSATAAQDGTPVVKTVFGGSPTLQPELAQTLSAGFVVQPSPTPGLSLSIDYTRIVISNEISDFANGNEAYFLSHESAFPRHVVRAPLTAADAALGDTGGVITEIDATFLNTGRTTVQAVDIDLSYEQVFPIGRLRVHASTTWEPSFVTQQDPFGQSYQVAGYADGPLKWRGNAGVDWRKGAFGASLNAQYMSSYNVAASTGGVINASGGPSYNQERIAEQGSSTIPAQFYMNLMLSYEFKAFQNLPIVYRFGVKNIFDQMPPLVAPINDFSQNLNNGPGYSLFGDPHGRMFTTSLSVTF